MAQDDLDRSRMAKRQFTAAVLEDLTARLQRSQTPSTSNASARSDSGRRVVRGPSPMRRVSGCIVTYEDVMEVVYARADEHRLLVSSDAVVTDGARQAAARYDVEIVVREQAEEGVERCS